MAALVVNLYLALVTHTVTRIEQPRGHPYLARYLARCPMMGMIMETVHVSGGRRHLGFVLTSSPSVHLYFVCDVSIPSSIPLQLWDNDAYRT